MRLVRATVIPALAICALTTGASPVSAKGEGVLNIVFAYESAWTSASDGTLIRWRADGTPLRRVKVTDSAAAHGLTAGFGAIWMSDNYSRVSRVPARGGSVTHVDGDWQTNPITTTADAVWVGNYRDGTILKLDPRSRRVATPRKVPGKLVRLSRADKGALWVVTAPGDRPVSGPRGTRFVHRLDVGAGEFAGGLATKCEVAVASGRAGAWISNFCDGTLREINRSATRFVGRPIYVGKNPLKVIVGTHAVWVMLTGESAIARLNPKTGNVAKYPLRAPVDFALGKGFVWILRENGRIARLDARRPPAEFGHPSPR